MEGYEDHIFGVWQPEGQAPVAAYVRFNHHHQALMVYNARTGRALTQEGHKTLAAVEAREPFRANPEEKTKVEYVGERNNPQDPVKHEVQKEGS